MSRRHCRGVADEAQCLPFSRYRTPPLYFSITFPTLPRVRQFYPDRLCSEWVKEEAGNVRYDDAGAKSLAMFCGRTEPQVGSGEKPPAHIERLKRCPDGQ